jgi:hypothetical protein
MLFGGLHQPSTAARGDFWYCYATRELFEYQVNVIAGITWNLISAGRYASAAPPPTQTSTSRPADPIWIDANDPDQVPRIWDPSGNWIPIIQASFTLPPYPPSVGDVWFDMNTLDGYTYDGADWVLSQTSQALQFNPQSLMTGAFGISAPMSGAVLSVSAPQPVSALTISDIVKIYTDGRIEYGPTYTPDEAAKILWEAIATFSPAYREGEEVKKLRDLIKYAEDKGFKWPTPKGPTDPNAAWDAAMGVVG